MGSQEVAVHLTKMSEGFCRMALHLTEPKGGFWGLIHQLTGQRANDQEVNPLEGHGALCRLLPDHQYLKHTDDKINIYPCVILAKVCVLTQP